MNKVKIHLFEDNRLRCVEFKCPGCGMIHQLTVGPHKNGAGASWTFTGDEANPTLSPSILSKCGPFPKDCDPAYIIGHSQPNSEGMIICHSFVRNGQIQFLGDCTHALANKTVDLPEYSPVDQEPSR